MTEVSVETCFVNLRVLSFSLKLLTYDRSWFCVLLWLFRAFYFLSFSFYLYQLRVRNCEKRARRSYLQLNMNWSNTVSDSGDILILMLAWQNKTSRLKQPNQVNHVINKTISHGVSRKITIQILSSPNRFSRWGSNESRLFSRSLIVDRRRS